MNKKELFKEKESYKLFKEIYKNEWQNLNKHTPIFENSAYNLNIDKEYKKFEESETYKNFLATDSKSDRMKIIQKFFYEESIIPIIQIIEEVLRRTNDLDFVKELMIEETFEYIQKKSLSSEELKFLKELEEAGIINNAKNIFYSIMDIREAVFKTLVPLLFFGISRIPGIKSEDFLKFFIDLNKLNSYLQELEKSSKLIKELDVEDKYSLDLEQIISNCIRKSNIVNLIPNSEFNFIKKLFSKVNQLRQYAARKDTLTRTLIISQTLKAGLLDPRKAKQFGDYIFCIHSTIINHLLGFAKFLIIETDIDQEILHKVKNFIKNKNKISSLVNDTKNLFNINSKNTDIALVFEEIIFFLLRQRIIFEKLSTNNFSKSSSSMIFIDTYKRLYNLINQAFDDLYLTLNQTEQYQKSNTIKSNSKSVDEKPKKESLFDI